METITTHRVNVSIKAGTVLLVSTVGWLLLWGINMYCPLNGWWNMLGVVGALMGGLMCGTHTNTEAHPADAYHPPLLDALDDVMFNHKSDDPAIQQAHEDDVDHARSMVRAIEAHFLDDVATPKQLELLRKAGFELMYPHGSGWTKGFKPVAD